MEGDAGASRHRLNPPPMSKMRRVRRRTRPRPQTVPEPEAGAAPANTTEVTAEDSPESEVGAESADTVVTAEDSPESEVEAEPAETVDAGVERGASRLGRGWLVGVSAALVLMAGGIGAGGYFALHAYQESRAIARNDAAALQAAKDCVAATQAPDTTAMAASEQKIIDCGTDEYRSQAIMNTSLLVEAYQAANVHLQVSDMRASVERNNSDGSVDVLVAVRIKVSTDQQQPQETGYRLRATMAIADGQYKIAKLESVTK